ncbi:MAG: dTMP kinase [Candidatus Omnitrophica bacterium]|nr:dTMP kinase [Candidatus Omnitrophota bacterium]
MKKKAFFITLEGLEGSGKSSVINFLENIFKKNKLHVVVFREPGSTRIGEKIREILLDKKNNELSSHTELLLYLAARTQLIEEKLQAALSKFDVVICDRFFDSTLVYQGYALGLGAIVEKAVAMFSLTVIPDLTFILDTPAKKGLARIAHKDRIESRPLRFHNKLRQGYLKLARKYPARIKVVDADSSLPDIYKKVESILKEKIISCKLYDAGCRR